MMKRIIAFMLVGRPQETCFNRYACMVKKFATDIVFYLK